MKKRLINFVVLLVALCCIALPIGVVNVHAGSCHGDGCEGLNPETMNCGSYVSSTDMTSENGLIETKSSPDCDSKWARLTNKSGVNKYIAASIRYGGNNYNQSHNVSTPALVDPEAVVYTPMTARRIKPAISCGRVSEYGPISTPVDNIDQYCNGVSQN